MSNPTAAERAERMAAAWFGVGVRPGWTEAAQKCREDFVAMLTASILAAEQAALDAALEEAAALASELHVRYECSGTHIAACIRGKKSRGQS